MHPGRALVSVFLAAALYYAVFGGEYSVFELRATRSALVEERIRLQEVRAEIDSLAAWADSLEHDPGVIERVAREEFGMIRSGEVLYRFADAEAGPEQEPEPER